MHRFGIIVACLFAITAWSRAASPNPADLEVTPELQVKTRVLVEQLGSDDYNEREERTATRGTWPPSKTGPAPRPRHQPQPRSAAPLR